MTEPGTPGQLEPESTSETTGASLPGALPSRRSLRAQRAAEGVDTSISASGTDLSATDAAREPRTHTGSHAAVPAVPVAPVVPSSAVVPSSVVAADAEVAPGSEVVPARRGLAKTARTPRAARPPRAPREKNRSGRSPKRVIAAILVVPGLFMTVALPAYAFAPGSNAAPFKASGAHVLAESGAQNVEVPSFSAKITVARDGYTAVSGEEIRRKAEEARVAAEEQQAAELAARAGGYSTPGQRAEGDDYPWAFESSANLSPLGYYYRECVDFVAWRLNRDRGSTGPWALTWGYMTPGGGSAWNWANAWESHGWQVSHDPIVGAVAWYTYNHVAYVQAVNGDGTVTIEEYNQQGDHSYHRRTQAISDVALFLYPPP